MIHATSSPRVAYVYAVGAPGLRNHGRELGVAERGQRAGAAKQQEREHQRRAGAGAHEVSRHVDLPSRGRPDRAEDAAPMTAPMASSTRSPAPMTRCSPPAL